MFYEIREKNGRFLLFLNKKNGFKYKRSFPDHESAEWYVKAYLPLCCLACKQKGWLYKVRGTGGMYGGGNRRNSKRGQAQDGSVVSCPECRAKHVVKYKDREVQGWIYYNGGRYFGTDTMKDFALKAMTD